MPNGEMVVGGESVDVAFDAEQAIRAAQEMIRHAQGERSWNNTGDVSVAVAREMPRHDDCSDDDDSCAEPAGSEPANLCYISQANDIGCSDGTACPDLCPE